MASKTIPVFINGAQIGGLICAAVYADAGFESVVVEPAGSIGGFTTGGLGSQDFNGREFRSPMCYAYYANIINQIQTAYGTSPGWEYYFDSSPADNKPKFTSAMARKAIDNIILTPARRAKITVLTNVGIVDVIRVSGKVTKVKLDNGDEYLPTICHEESYGQELARKAKVSMTSGRESKNTYGEFCGGVYRPTQNTRSPNLRAPDTGNIWDRAQLAPMAPDGYPDTSIQEFVFRMEFANGSNRMIYGGHGPNGTKSTLDPYVAGTVAGVASGVDSYWPRPHDSKGRVWYAWDFKWCPEVYGGATQLSNISSFTQTSPDTFAANGPTICGLSLRFAECKTRQQLMALWQDAFYQQAGVYWWACWSPDSPAALRANLGNPNAGVADTTPRGPMGLPANLNQNDGEFFCIKGWVSYWYQREGFRCITRRVISLAQTLDVALAKGVADPITLGGYGFDRHECVQYPLFANGTSADSAGEGVLPTGEDPTPEGGTMGVKTFQIGLDHTRPVKGQADNLLLGTGFGTSSVTTGPIRIEPIYQTLGEVHGIIGVQCLNLGVSPADVTYAQIKPALVAAGIATTY